MSQSFSPIQGLQGQLQPPGDKSISHRALLLAAIAQGESEILGLPNGEDVDHTLKAVCDLGTEVSEFQNEAEMNIPQAQSLKVKSLKVKSLKVKSLKLVGGNLQPPKTKIYVGNSGTGIRLLTGILAGQDFTTILDGDQSIRKRPMDRIIEPLTQMGAKIQTKNGYAPLTISGGKLVGIEYKLPVASAQVKSAILLAGLFAEGHTSVIENVQTRIHSEELLKVFGANINLQKNSEGQSVAKVVSSKLTGAKIVIPGDPSAAAFWAVAGCIVANANIQLTNTYLGTGRDGFIDVLKRMGADIEVVPNSTPNSSSIGADSPANSVSTNSDTTNAYRLNIRSSELTGVDVFASEIPSLIDEIPILCIAAAHCQGETRFFNVGELRHKESNRIESLREAFHILGGDLTTKGDTLIVKGTEGLKGGKIDSMGDHRIAMAFAIAGLASKPGSKISIKGFKNATATSYGNFLEDLKVLQQ